MFLLTGLRDRIFPPSAKPEPLIEKAKEDATTQKIKAVALIVFAVLLTVAAAYLLAHAPFVAVLLASHDKMGISLLAILVPLPLMGAVIHGTHLLTNANLYTSKERAQERLKEINLSHPNDLTILENLAKYQFITPEQKAKVLSLRQEHIEKMREYYRAKAFLEGGTELQANYLGLKANVDKLSSEVRGLKESYLVLRNEILGQLS